MRADEVERRVVAVLASFPLDADALPLIMALREVLTAAEIEAGIGAKARLVVSPDPPPPLTR